ncbi:MAG: hypothetical protein ABIJ34_05955 [archaeon]
MKKLAFIITYIGMFLPYRLRIVYGFTVNFLLNSVLNHMRLLLRIIVMTISSIILFIIYFTVIPITILLQLSTFQNHGYISIYKSDIRKRY